MAKSGNFAQNPPSGHFDCYQDVSTTRVEDRLHGTFRQSHCNQLSRFLIDRNKKLVAPNAKAVRASSMLSLASQHLALCMHRSQKHNHCRCHFPSAIAGPPRSEVAPTSCTCSRVLDAPWQTGFQVDCIMHPRRSFSHAMLLRVLFAGLALVHADLR